MSDNDLRKRAGVIFRRAATYIRCYGWQVSGMSEDGLPRCSMGALASAYKAGVWNKKLAELMYQSLYQERDGLTLTEFNYTYRDGEMVAKLFDHVAARLLTKQRLILTP
jgi:hypothetical protein